jgi:hypothetical protein
MAAPSPADLTREKTLFGLWRTSFRFRQRPFNFIITATVAVLLMRYCSLVWDQPQTILAALRKMEGTGLAFATSILGFLVAGFTVFVTVTRIDMFLEMAKREKPGTGESYLKYNLSAFIVAFVHYVCYIFFCLMCELFMQPGGLASVAIANARSYPSLARVLQVAQPWIVSVLFVAFGTWTMYLVLQLKSFVFNVYQVTTTLVAFEWTKPQEIGPSADSSSANGTE